MRSALVLGGTRFIGRHLVELLLARGVRVTIATRGRTPDPFGRQVARLVLDRSLRSSAERALGDGTWDVCFDQSCMSGDDAEATRSVLRGRIERLVHTSSGAIYRFGPERHPESDFDPTTHPALAGGQRALGYEEGKRQAERGLFAAPPASAVAVRLPMILATDDFTGKLQSLLAHGRAGTPARVRSAAAATHYLAVDEAARFLAWAATAPIAGPMNACSTEAISIRELSQWMEDGLGTRIDLEEGPMRPGLVPLALHDSLLLDNTLATSLGFRFAPLDAWLPALIQGLA